MSVVCIDTQILFWAIEKRGTTDQKLLTFAPQLLRFLENRNDRIIIPSIVVGELLVPIDDARIAQFLNQFKTDWRIVEYDLRCAVQFSRMRRNQALKERFKSIQDLQGITRRELIADVMIIATAIANNADTIYSHDGPLREVAMGWIEAKDLFDENLQAPLFDDSSE